MLIIIRDFKVLFQSKKINCTNLLGNCQIGHAIDVLETRMLKEDRAPPESYIYNLLITACGEVGYVGKAFSLYRKVGFACFYPQLQWEFQHTLIKKERNYEIFWPWIRKHSADFQFIGSGSDVFVLCTLYLNVLEKFACVKSNDLTL